MFHPRSASARAQCVITASDGADTIRSAVSALIPADAPFQPVREWSSLACAVCGHPATFRRVTFLDHARQEALFTGLCSLVGHAVLLRAVEVVWALDRPDREVRTVDLP